jgi:hypothetical protein
MIEHGRPTADKSAWHDSLMVPNTFDVITIPEDQRPLRPDVALGPTVVAYDVQICSMATVIHQRAWNDYIDQRLNEELPIPYTYRQYATGCTAYKKQLIVQMELLGTVLDVHGPYDAHFLIDNVPIHLQAFINAGKGFPVPFILHTGCWDEQSAP